ncbi:unnamed protein product [Chrysodeixis includens]|uniref:Ig-like domain-containing protein n=1 Tax=Chrysodeixis includens TaxID=689277 RepID=A0A9P0FUU4_CHRIL|nr:unnamed protein product [Chrysodeixis includens]
MKCSVIQIQSIRLLLLRTFFFSDNDVIVIEFSENNNITLKYTVIKNKPLHIILKNYYLIQLQCFDYNVRSKSSYLNFFSETHDTFQQDGNINIQNVTDDMSTKWRCTVYRLYTGGPKTWINNEECSAFDLFFNLHVKGAEKVSFTVNNQDLELSDLSTKLDGETNYEYLDGAPLFVTCNMLMGRKRLAYYDDKGKLLFQTKWMDTTIKFRSVLTARNNYFYVECECHSETSIERYYHRITFVLKKPDSILDDVIKLSVNSLTLAPEITYSDDKRIYNYFYEYGFESSLNVSHVSSESVMKCSEPELGGPSILTETSKQLKMENDQIPTERLNNKTLNYECVDANNSVVSVKLNFQDGMLAFPGARILGLPEKNIQYEYIKDSRNYSISYTYTLNETVNLTCVTNRRISSIEKFVWRHNGNSSSVAANFRTNNTVSGSLSLRLTAKYNATFIYCDVVNKHGTIPNIVEVFLNLNPFSEESTSLVTDENEALMILGGSIAAMFAVVLAVFALCWYTRSKRIVNEDNYENFSNASTVPTHHCHATGQWENNYEDPSKYYATIRTSEVPSETHYTEIDYYFINRLPNTRQGLASNETGYDHLHRNSNTPSTTNTVVFRNNCQVNKGNNSSVNCNLKNNSLYQTKEAEDESGGVYSTNDNYVYVKKY